MSMKLGRIVLGNTWLFTTSGRIARWLLPKLPRFMVYNRLNTWGRQRELPDMPKESFRQIYRKTHGKKS
jgi:L-lactate dehydrogenase complex protein LldF